MTNAKELNPILDKLKSDIFDYLPDLHNNQIKGFYSWDGYWKCKDELELTPDQKKYLPELYDYMNSITITDIVKAAQDQGREWLHKYGNYGRGRRSDSQKYASKQASCYKNSDFIKKNFEILIRVKMFVGFYLGIFNEIEVINLIEDTKNHELNSTFYTNKKSRISNAIFRLKILLTFLKDSPFAVNCINELKALAIMQVEYLKEAEGITLDISGFKSELEPIQAEIKELKNTLTNAEETKKGLQDSINKLEKDKRDISAKYHISEFNQIIEYI